MTPASSPTGLGRSVPAALATLKDIAGIAGSFVFTTTGRLVAREIQSVFDDATLNEAAQRLTRLQDTFASVGDDLDWAVIRFQDHRLYLKVLTGGMLCILADGVVNMAALRMAAHLVGRRIAPELEQAEAASPPLPPPPVEAESAPRETEPAFEPRPPVFVPGTGVRRFRGRTVP